MYSKKSLVLFAAAVVPLASPALARDSGHWHGVRQTHLDEQYARKHPTSQAPLLDLAKAVLDKAVNQ